MNHSEQMKFAAIHRMRSTLVAIPSSCKTVPHHILLIGLFSTLIGGVQDTWAACTPASPTTGATVTCTGSPNTFFSAVNGLTVNVNAGAALNSTLGGIALNLTGNNITLTNNGTIDPAFLGPLTVLSGGVVIGNNTNISTINITNTATGIIGGTATTLGGNITSLTGLALNVTNGVGGVTNITNNGTIKSTAMLNIPLFASDALLAAFQGGGQINFTNNTDATITGRISFVASDTGNTFTNAGTISGGVNMGSGSAPNTFTAITGSAVNAGGGIGIGISGIGLTFSATGQIDGGGGGNNSLVLQNPIGVGGGTTGTGTVDSANYVNFNNLTMNSGTWTLTGPLVSGATTLNGGIAIFDSTTSFGSGVLTSNDGTLQANTAGLNLNNLVTLESGGLTVQGSNAMTLSGVISGSGALIKSGSTTLTLNGNNTYSGGTTLNAGTLIAGNNSALSTGDLTIAGISTLDNAAGVSLSNSIALNSNLTLAGNNALTLTGVISGASALSKNGTATLTLNGVNTYTGSTTLDGGSLFVGGNSALGSSVLTTADDTTLDAMTPDTSATLSNNITLDGNLIIGGSQSLNLSGVLSGAGGLTKNGSAKLTLDGINTYNGPTTINEGSLIIGSDNAHSSAKLSTNAVDLQINNGITLGGYGAVQGNVSVNDSGILAPGNSIGTFTVNGDLTLSNNSILNFEFGNGVGDDVIVNGNLNIGSSKLNVLNFGGFSPGIYNLFTYTGSLNESAGGITFGTTPPGTSLSLQELPGQINLINTAGGTLNFWNPGATPTPGGSGGTGVWTTSAPVWTDVGGTTLGPMSPQPGFAIFFGTPGTVNISGSSGQVTVTGMQFVVDGYTLEGESLLLNNGGAPAIIRVSDTSSSTAIINNMLSGSGGIDKQDIGTLILNGVNTYTGTTLLTAGILAISNDNNLGNVNNGLDFRGGTLETTANVITSRATTLEATGGTFLTDAGTSLSHFGAISGSGALTKNGAGDLLLYEINSYTGGTIVNEGLLQAETPGAFVNNTAYTVNGGTLDLAIFDLEMSSLSGNGGTIDTRDTTLTDNQTINTSFAGSILGSNLFIKEGSGSLTLTGDSSTFTGTSQVNAGTLQVNGTLGGDLLVNIGGRIEGVGTVGNTAVFGTIAPGTGGLQTLNVDGNYVQNAGSTYQAQINPAGQSSLIQVSGNAQLNGGNVNVTAENGTYILGHYTLLNAIGSVSGTYSSLTQPLPFITFKLIYDAHNVFLDLVQSNVTFPDVAVTPNQRVVAEAIENLGAGNPLFDTVLSLPSAQSARNAFNSLSGEVYAATIGSLIEASRYVEDAMLNHMTTPALEHDTIHKAYNVWAQGVGSWGHRDGTINAARVTNGGGGIFIGADANNDLGRFGVLAGYSALQTNLEARRSSTSSDNYHLGLYADQRFGKFALRTGGAYSWHDLDARRAVVFPGLSELLKSDYLANTAQAFLESGYAFERGSWLAEPFARASAIHVGSDTFYEKGGIAALKSQGNNENVYYSTLGGRIYNTFKQEANFVLKGRGLLGWRHAFNNINPLAKMAFDTSIPFTIGGSPIARNGLVIDAGVDALLPNKALTLTLSYTGQVASRVQDHGVRGVISWRFS